MIFSCQFRAPVRTTPFRQNYVDSTACVSLAQTAEFRWCTASVPRIQPSRRAMRRALRSVARSYPAIHGGMSCWACRTRHTATGSSHAIEDHVRAAWKQPETQVGQAQFMGVARGACGGGRPIWPQAFFGASMKPSARTGRTRSPRPSLPAAPATTDATRSTRAGSANSAADSLRRRSNPACAARCIASPRRGRD